MVLRLSVILCVLLDESVEERVDVGVIMIEVFDHRIVMTVGLQVHLGQSWAKEVVASGHWLGIDTHWVEHFGVGWT